MEIILGSELVLLAKNQEEVLQLLHQAECYMDKVLYDILEEMLEDGYFGKATDYIEAGILKNPEIVP